MSKQTLLFNVGILTMDAGRRMYNNGAILLQGDRIERVGRSQDLLAEAGVETQCMDLRGRWILPGLINTHVHQAQQLARGIADDVDLLTWLRERIWPFESSMTEEDTYTSALMCGIEQIRSGVTTFAEAGGQHVNGMARAVSELGLRAALSRSTMDTGEGLPASWNETTERALEIQVDNFERWNGKANGRIRVWFGLRTIFNNTDQLILRTKQAADRYATGIHMHVAEVKEEVEFVRQKHGVSTVTYLNELGLLDRNLLAVHSVWVNNDEIAMFVKNDVKVSHCPAAAMRVLGFARVPEMLDAGVCVSIGTDGAPANNRMTLIDEMWLAWLIHKGRKQDPTTVPAESVLAMATCDGARALLWEREIGSLEAGKKADLVVINPNTATMLPLHDPVANMVSALRTQNVESVMINGRWVLQDGKVLTVDEAAVLEEARKRAAALAWRAGVRLPDRFAVVDKLPNREIS